MQEFTTYVFKENEILTNNIRVKRERPYYIGVLIILISVLLYILDFDYAIPFGLFGALVVFIGKMTMSGRSPSVGHRQLRLRLTADSIYLGNERLEIKSKEDIEITIVGYKGQMINQQIALYQTHNGNDNLMRIKYGEKVSEFKFVLESETHKNQLVRFCEMNGFRI